MTRFPDDELVRIVDIEQDTEEWLEWRNQGIGSSDIALLLDSKPVFDRTVGTLWKQRVGYERAVRLDNEHIKRGKDLEPKIRDMVNNELGFACNPACIERIDRTYLRASLDGIDYNENVLLEIKAPSDPVYDKYLKQWKIPANYYAQMQYQMLVSNVDYGIFAYTNSALDRPKIHFVPNDLPLQLEIERRCELFWYGVQNKIPVGWGDGDLQLFYQKPTMFLMVIQSKDFFPCLGELDLPLRAMSNPEARKESFIFITLEDEMKELIEVKRLNPNHEIKVINLAPSMLSSVSESREFSRDLILEELMKVL